MPRIYRVEHKDTGVGPWVDRSSAGINRHANGHLAQSAFWDIPGFRDGKHFCACRSMKQLRVWFGTRTCVERLRRKGFTVRVYLVKSFLNGQGGMQVGFVKKDAKLIREIPVSALYSDEAERLNATVDDPLAYDSGLFCELLYGTRQKYYYDPFERRLECTASSATPA